MPTSRMVSSMPGIDFSAPERTETNSGARGSPNRCFVADSSQPIPAVTPLRMAFVAASSPAMTPAQRLVGSTKAGGTCRRSPIIRASSAAFDPTCAAEDRARRTALTDEDRFVIPGDHAESPCNMRSRSDIAAWASRSVVSSSARAISRPRTKVRVSPSSARRGSRLPSPDGASDPMIAPIAARSAASASRSPAITASTHCSAKSASARLPSGNLRWRLQSRSPDRAAQSFAIRGELGKRRAEPVGAIVLRRKTDEKRGLVEAIGRVLDLIDQATAMRSRCELGRTSPVRRRSADRTCPRSAWLAAPSDLRSAALTSRPGSKAVSIMPASIRVRPRWRRTTARSSLSAVSRRCRQVGLDFVADQPGSSVRPSDLRSRRCRTLRRNDAHSFSPSALSSGTP